MINARIQRLSTVQACWVLRSIHALFFDAVTREWTRQQLLMNRMTLADVGLQDPTPEEIHDGMVRDRESTRVAQTTVSFWLAKIPSLHTAQRKIFDCVTQAAVGLSEPRGLFYLDAVAGCGKTHVCQCISAKLRSSG